MNSYIYFPLYKLWKTSNSLLHDLIVLKNIVFTKKKQSSIKQIWEIKVFSTNSEVELLFVLNKQVLRIQVIS
jgi:hypothetical protein